MQASVLLNTANYVAICMQYINEEAGLDAQGHNRQVSEPRGADETSSKPGKKEPLIIQEPTRDGKGHYIMRGSRSSLGGIIQGKRTIEHFVHFEV